MSRRTNLPLTPTFIDGLLLLTNGVPDSSLVIDCANCGNDKFAMVGGQHDHMSSLTQRDRQHRVRFSDLKANDMIMGTEAKVRKTVLDIVEKQDPAFLFVVQSSAVQLIGTDVDRVAETLEQELSLPMGVVPPKPLTGDFLDGFEAGLSVLARRLPLEKGKARDGTVGIVGNLFERFEEDQRGNARELKRMLNALDLELVSTWLDGSPTTKLTGIEEASTVLALPQGRRAASIIAKRTGASVLPIDAPVGLDGSLRWMRAIGQRLDRADRAEQFIEEELRAIVPKLEKAISRTFMNRDVALLADPHHALELTRALAELGFRVPCVALLARRKKQGAQFQESLNREFEGTLEPEVILDPSFNQLSTKLEELKEAGRLDLVIGSGVGRDAVKPLGVPYLELLHPCYVRHALFDAPWFGFKGILWLADALFNRLNEADYLAY